MAIVGYYAPRGLFIAQNSWGYGWSCATIPAVISDDELARLYPTAEGRKLRGCYWLDPAVIEGAWTVDALQVTPA
jgi:hypothetical protein